MKTIKDRLAHLSFRRACQLLGPQGESLLRRGGNYDIDIDLQVTLREDLFRVLIDQSVVEISAEGVQALARKERVATAGGQLLGAAFNFMGEIFAGREETEQTRQVAQVLKQQLAQCLQPDNQGRLQMTITLPDDSALDSLARPLARIMGGQAALGNE